ncbi:MAG: T9SS type A sorting domain-containing protein [Lentimicrobium sp.]|nr:T9SS type A sorting domain-containing protein [Lentimicrobium sp.]
MRKIFTLTIFSIFFAFIANAQQVLYYNFENTLQESSVSGPDLTVLGETGVFEIATLNEISQQTKTVYRFVKNSGLQFNNAAAGNFIGDNYTIEIYFVFDELSSWKRVVDWKNRKTDWGAYVYNGELNFYNILYSEEAPVIEGEFTYYVITRTAENGQVLIYTDAQVKIDFIDNGGHALVDEDGVVNFFQDDLVVGNEASSGSIAMLKLYNYPLQQTQITENWNALGSQVFGINDPVERVPVMVYPNPAALAAFADLASFDQGKEVEIRLFNSDGRMVYQTTATGGNMRAEIGISLLPPGMYLLKAKQGNKMATSKITVR